MEVLVVEAHVRALKDLKGRDVGVRLIILVDFTLVILFTRLVIVYYFFYP